MLTTDVENYPGFKDGIQGPELMAVCRAQAERFGTEFITADVTKAELEGDVKKVWVEDKCYEAKTLIISTGASANLLGLENETRLMGRGVSTCATCKVEHPVTECVTGLDLVELMIRVAAGEKLPLTQDDVSTNGWAIECRVYAEDPTRNFLPSIGRLIRYREPVSEPGTRIDSGVYEGGEISIYYDPMIAKLITEGADRGEAVARMRRALDAFHIRGVAHNLSFLNALMKHPRFLEGRLSTDFIADEFPDGFAAIEPDEDTVARFVVLAAALHRQVAERATRISGQLDGRDAVAGDDWVVVVAGDHFPVHAIADGDRVEVSRAGHGYEVEGSWRPGTPFFRGVLDGAAFCVQIDRVGLGYRLTEGGSTIEVQVITPRMAELARFMPVKEDADTSKFLLSPMPGLLVSIDVDVGQEVKAGQELAVIEAMKMENILRAERDGAIKTLHADPGESLAVDQAILEFE